MISGDKCWIVDTRDNNLCFYYTARGMTSSVLQQLVNGMHIFLKQYIHFIHHYHCTYLYWVKEKCSGENLLRAEIPWPSRAPPLLILSCRSSSLKSPFWGCRITLYSMLIMSLRLCHMVAMRVAAQQHSAFYFPSSSFPLDWCCKVSDTSPRTGTVIIREVGLYIIPLVNSKKQAITMVSLHILSSSLF